MDPFLSLRQLLEGPPSPTLFRFILEAFAYWNDEDSLPTALDFAEQHLGEWDDSLRHAKLRELYEEGQLHPASRLVRSLCLHADLSEDTWHTLLSSGAFDHITHLSFSHYLDASWKTLSPWLHRIQTQLKGLSLDQCPPPIAQELPTHLADLPALQSLTLTYKSDANLAFLSRPLPSLKHLLPDIARPLGEREERTTTPQERLEGYLKQPPSRELFEAIIELLSAWPARQEPEKALAKAKEAMAEWSDDCCYASLSEIWPGVPQTEPPAVFSLVRTLFVPGGLMADELFQPFLKQLTAPHIKHITCERPTFSSQSLQSLARTSALSGLLSVKLPAAALDPFSGIALARSPHLQQVTHWHWHNLQDDQELLALIKTGLIKKATTLSLSFARLSEASLQPLRELQESGKLDTLDLYATSPTQLDAFVKSALFASVREVRLTDTKFPEDLSAHFAADDWAHVTSLVFTRVDDCDRILSHWAQETAPLSLQSLEVESCLTEEGLEALTQSAQYSALQTLKLERCYKLPTGAQETLFRSTQLASLETLCIDSTGSWGWSFVRSIKDTEPRGLPKLKHLFIITNHMDDAELKLLIQHYGVDLETLELSRCNLRSKVFKELAKSSHLPHLQALILRGNESTKTGIKMLSQSTHSLCHLECVGNPGYTEGLPDLVASVRLSQEAKRSALSSAFHTDLIELARHFQLPAPESYHKQELLAFLSTQSGPPKTSQEAKEPLSQEEAALLQKTKKELMKLAKIHLIPRRSSMSKQELAHALSQKMNPL